jgi:hypothetical protein
MWILLAFALFLAIAMFDLFEHLIAFSALALLSAMVFLIIAVFVKDTVLAFVVMLCFDAWIINLWTEDEPANGLPYNHRDVVNHGNHLSGGK